jgi:hypothetical protein
MKANLIDLLNQDVKEEYKSLVNQVIKEYPEISHLPDDLIYSYGAHRTFLENLVRVIRQDFMEKHLSAFNQLNLVIYDTSFCTVLSLVSKEEQDWDNNYSMDVALSHRMAGDYNVLYACHEILKGYLFVHNLKENELKNFLLYHIRKIQKCRIEIV